jgi:hypothetical protein
MKIEKARQQNRPSSRRPKISQRLLQVAGDFIGIGSTLEDRRNRLTAACSAWNMACHIPELRKKHLDHYMQSYGEFNPNADAEHLENVWKDMERLIETKLKMFPDDLRQVMRAGIVSVQGVERIEAVAIGL